LRKPDKQEKENENKPKNPDHFPIVSSNKYLEVQQRRKIDEEN